MSEEVNPYASPQTICPPASAGVNVIGRTVVHPFVSGHTRAMLAVGFLALCAFTDLLEAGSNYMQLRLLQRAQAGVRISPEEATGNDVRVRAVAGLGGIAYLASGIVFLIWFHRAHRNLPSLDNERLKYSPGWAVGAWFVPFLNLVRPFQIMVEVWKGSDPKNLANNLRDPAHAHGSILIGVWWAAFLLQAFASYAHMGPAAAPKTINTLVAITWIGLGRDLLVALPAALLAILVVYKVDANQTARYEMVQRSKEMGSTPAGGQTGW
jgi:hypothetical protein